MAQYISKDALVEEIERRIKSIKSCPFRYAELGSEKLDEGELNAYNEMLSFINTIEVKEVDLEKESELIANGIMISVQSNKYGTNTYNTERNDFNHYHLKMAARKGIELGLKAQKGE